MDKRICLDSDILIGVLRQDLKVKRLIENLNDELCTTSVNSFEVWMGRKNSEKTEELLARLTTIPLDQKSAKRAGDIHRELAKNGNIIEFRDLFVGAIAIENGLVLATLNKKHFERLADFGLKMLEG